MKLRRKHFLAIGCLMILCGAMGRDAAAAPSGLRPNDEESLRRRVSHILVATKDEALEVRKEILAKGGDRKAFRAAARVHSKDVTTKRLGGDLGWVEKGSSILDPQFLEATFRLEVGQVSQPVNTEFGWSLIFVAEGQRKSSGDVDRPEGKKGTEAARIVERYIRVAGGKETFAAIRDRTVRFENVKYSTSGQTVAAINLFLKRGVKIREEWEIEGFKIKGEPLSFIQIYNGDEGWVKMTGTVSPLEGRVLNVFVWDKYIDNFFLHWEADGYQLKHLGKESVDGESADVVEVVDFIGHQRVRYYFSRANGLLLKKDWQDTKKDSASGVERAVAKEQYYKNYTKIVFADGSERSIRFPMRFEIDLDGSRDTERIYKEVSINTGLSDELFAKPSGKAFIKESEGNKKARF